MDQKKVYGICDKIAFGLLCILMADCCITGAGRIVMIGPLSVRMIVLALILLVSLPLFFADYRRLLRSPIMWAICAFVAWLALETVIGIVKGNSISLIAQDLKGFAYLVLFPAAICILRSKERVHLLMKTMMYASGVLGIIVLIHFILYVWFSDVFLQIYRWGLRTQFSAISPVSATIPRLFFKSSAYFLVGCAFPVYFQMISEKPRWHYSAIAGLSLFCLFMTYTRSLYLGVGVAALTLFISFLMFMRKNERKRFGTQIVVTVVIMCLILTAFGIACKTEYVGFAIRRTLLALETEPTQPSTEPSQPSTEPTVPPTDKYEQDTISSDQLRAETLTGLRKLIRQSPLYGNGLGTSLEWRDNNEYFYLDLTAKTGVIGLLLNLLPAFLLLLQIITGKDELREKKLLLVAWLSVLLGFMSFSFFNPYMNASLGILYYACVAGVFHAVKND